MTLREEAERAAEGGRFDARGPLRSDSGLGVADKAAPIVGQLADAASTLYALDRNPAAREANRIVARLTDRPTLFVVGKAAVGVSVALLADFAAHHGRPRAARWMARLAGALGVGVAVHNVRVGLR